MSSLHPRERCETSRSCANGITRRGKRCTLASIHASRGQESSVFGVLNEEDNLGNDMSKLVMVVAMGYFPASHVLLAAQQLKPKSTAANLLAIKR